MDLRPHHIGIVVSDLERSIAFYEALGFRTVRVMDSDDGSRVITFMGLGGMQVELFWYATTPAPAERGEKRLGFAHLALDTVDVVAALAELKATGLVPDDVQPRVVPPDFTLAYILDPDGAEIELMQRD